ncbi:MAG: hypothetical protein ACI4O3_06265 [Oscillospiraceae bacterium]
MTFYEWVRECLQREAAETEPDRQKTVQKVLEEIKTRKKRE